MSLKITIFLLSVSMYRLHNSSEHSGVTNMYSLSASRSGTPTQVLGGNQTSALLHSQHHSQPGILVGGANHPSNNPSHVAASSSLMYPHHVHNNQTASQFTLQLDELDQMQMMHHQQQGIDGHQVVNGGMSHSHTLPHNLSHQRKFSFHFNYRNICHSIYIYISKEFE